VLRAAARSVRGGVVANTAGWTLAMAVIFAGAGVPTDATPVPLVLAATATATATAGMLAGLAVGAVTGFALLRLGPPRACA